MMATAKELLLGTPNELKSYLDTLPLNSELRFPSVTSHDGTFAVNIIVYDKEKKAFLFGVYKTNLSGLPKQKVETDSSITDTTQTVFALSCIAILKETGLEALKVKLLGAAPYKIDNNDPSVESETHERFYVFVDSFTGILKVHDEILSPKFGPCVWVKSFLLEVIFNKPRHLAGSVPRVHAQKEAYRRLLTCTTLLKKAPKKAKKGSLKQILRDNLKKNFFRN